MRNHTVTLDVDVNFDGTRTASLVAEVFWPSDGRGLTNPIVLICLPGGSMNRSYFDLGGEGSPSFSFARHMAQHGLITVSIDHLGVGDSTRPKDGFALTPDVLAAANGEATRQIVEGLKTGSLLFDLAPLHDLVTIGVGHSMGGLLTAIQQAKYAQHAGVVLLGFSNNGLIAHLPEQARFLIDAPESIPEKIADVAREIYQSPYPELPRSSEGNAMFYGSKADRDGVTALKAARDTMLMVAGLQSMIPGGVTSHLAKIDVPVLLGLGDQDIAGLPQAIPASFTGSNDISLVVLRDTGHCHFIFPSRDLLFERVAQWAAGIRDSR